MAAHTYKNASAPTMVNECPSSSVVDPATEYGYNRKSYNTADVFMVDSPSMTASRTAREGSSSPSHRRLGGRIANQKHKSSAAPCSATTDAEERASISSLVRL